MLFLHCFHSLETNDAPQTPAFGSLPGHEGGDILFSSPIGEVKPLPIALDFPLAGASDYFVTGVTSRGQDSSILDVSIDHVGENVSLFAEYGQQWAVIIGTNPAFLFKNERRITSEFIDACDIFDWFSNPDIYGTIEDDHLFLWLNEQATSENVYSSLQRISEKIEKDDCLLFYFSGQGSKTSGEIVLYDHTIDKKNVLIPNASGGISADWLVKWCNDLPARKVVCILDCGCPAFYKASEKLGPGRYLISLINSITFPRNGFITWYARRAVQKLGKKITVALLAQILEKADQYFREKRRTSRLVYLRGQDSVETLLIKYMN